MTRFVKPCRDHAFISFLCVSYSKTILIPSCAITALSPTNSCQPRWVQAPSVYTVFPICIYHCIGFSLLSHEISGQLLLSSLYKMRKLRNRLFSYTHTHTPWVLIYLMLLGEDGFEKKPTQIDVNTHTEGTRSKASASSVNPNLFNQP